MKTVAMKAGMKNPMSRLLRGADQLREDLINPLLGTRFQACRKPGYLEPEKIGKA